MTPARLSRRELQVAKLVAEGLTNREIADRLVVSERTAEFHVEQIRNKLGFHSRRQIAGWLQTADAAARRGPADTRAAKAPHHPRTQYARSNDVNVAFQVFGAGPFDLVVVPGWVSHLEHMWQHPFYEAYLQRLSRFARLILFDKRGTGLSDRVSIGTLDDRVDDIRVVMDALGIRRAAIYGISEGGPLALMFAATYPDRVSGLVVYGSFARRTWAPDYPLGVSMDAWLQQTDFTERNWPVIDLERWAPSVADDEQFKEWLGEVRRYGAGPGTARELMEVIGEIDVRPILPAIHVPTLVMHRSADATISKDMGRVIADAIPGAVFVELPGADHLPWTGDTEALIGEIEEFLTGKRIHHSADRTLATILVGDLVSSSVAASRVEFDKTMAVEVARRGGRVADVSGDRLIATFHGPAQAVRCAHALLEAASAAGIPFRAGIHTGESEVGEAALTGAAVEIARQVADRALPGEALVSSTVRDLMAGSGFGFKSRGKLGQLQLDAALQREPAPPRRRYSAAPAKAVELH